MCCHMADIPYSVASWQVLDLKVNLDMATTLTPHTFDPEVNLVIITITLTSNVLDPEVKHVLSQLLYLEGLLAQD